jgi:uncharacterized RDD family membrane protein YckC
MNKFVPPGFFQRAAAAWVDFILLLGSYIVLGALSEVVLRRDAFPPPQAMQLYSQRDFAVFVFFASGTVILTIIYLFLCYTLRGATFGQRLAQIRVLDKQGGPIRFRSTAIRTAIAVLRLFLIFIPGPIIAIAFLIIGSNYLNPALSMALLVGVLFGMVYISYAKYRSGRTRSATDYLSGTIVAKYPPLSISE